MRRIAALGLAAGLLAGCSGGDDDRFSVETVTPTTYALAGPTAPPVVAAPATAAPIETVPAAPAAAPASAPAPTPPPTAAPAPPPGAPVPTPPLPVPIAPPPEDGTTEPEVQLGAIEIPRLGLRRTLYEGIKMPTLDKGPGHWPGTAMPGQLGNVVVAGHRVSHAADFADLDELTPGDEVVFETATGRHSYLVVNTQIVEPEATWIVSQTADHIATLFACHPPGSVRQRIVVNLELASPPV